MKGAVCKDNPYTLLELKEAVKNFIRETPPIQLSRVFANKKCVHVSTSTYGTFPVFSVT
jgi:hypothetical protein